MNLERQLALQRAEEAKIIFNFFQVEAKAAQVKVAEADIQIGMAKGLLKSRNVDDEGSEDDIHSSPVDADESESDSDLEAGMSPRTLCSQGRF